MAMTRTTRNSDGGFSAFTYHVLVVVFVLAVALLLWRIIDAILLAFIGVLLAVMLRGLAGLLSQYLRIPIRWALLLVVVLLIGLVVLLSWFAGPQINRQMAQFLETAPNSVNQIRDMLTRTNWGRYILESMGTGDFSVGHGISLFSRVTGVASALFTIVANFLVVTFVAIFFAADPDLYTRGLILLAPKSESARIAETVRATGHTLRYWLLGQAISMFAVGVLTVLGLWIVGVPLAFLLGVIAGLLEFVPFFGPVAAAVPGILVALTLGWKTALYAALVYVIVQQLENRLIVPVVQWKAVALPPALIILAVVALGLLFGLLGILVATPLTAVVMVWIKMLYVHDVLEKPVSTE